MGIEAGSYFARKFEVLGLVFADWDVRGVIEEDVGSLQNGIGEQAKLECVFVGGGGEW